MSLPTFTELRGIADVIPDNRFTVAVNNTGLLTVEACTIRNGELHLGVLLTESHDEELQLFLNSDRITVTLYKANGEQAVSWVVYVKDFRVVDLALAVDASGSTVSRSLARVVYGWSITGMAVLTA